MNTIDKIKESVKLGILTEKQALDIMFNFADINNKFVNNLIDKYTKQKELALKNCKLMKDHSKYELYNSTFNNTHLFIFDLEDIKCRSGLTEL